MRIENGTRGLKICHPPPVASVECFAAKVLGLAGTEGMDEAECPSWKKNKVPTHLCADHTHHGHVGLVKVYV